LWNAFCYKHKKINCKKKNIIKNLSHNNSYGNYAGSYLNECLPNIQGQIIASRRDGGSCYATGVFTQSTSWTWSADVDDKTIRECNYYFSASSSNDTYRNNCLAIRVKSYGVYMWVRTS
jgi:hypothetical protein